MERTELNTTVLKTTFDSLEKASQTLGITSGELIDRMTLNWEAKDPVYAAQLILEDIIGHCNRLEEHQVGEAVQIVLAIIKGCIGDLTPERIKQTAAEYFEHLSRD